MQVRRRATRACGRGIRDVAAEAHRRRTERHRDRARVVITLRVADLVVRGHGTIGRPGPSKLGSAPKSHSRARRRASTGGSPQQRNRRLLAGERRAILCLERPWPLPPDPVDAPDELPLPRPSSDLAEQGRFGRRRAGRLVGRAARVHRSAHEHAVEVQAQVLGPRRVRPRREELSRHDDALARGCGDRECQMPGFAGPRLSIAPTPTLPWSTVRRPGCAQLVVAAGRSNPYEPFSDSQSAWACEHVLN